MKAFRCLVIGVLLACAAGAEAQPYYAGWAVGKVWDGYGTIIRSADSGNTWTRQGVGQIADVDMAGVFAVDPWTAWVVGHSEGGYATIYHTTNGGSTWERKGSPADVPNVGLGKVHAYGDRVWAVGTAGIMHTSDGGATWTNQLPAQYAGMLLQGVYTVDGNTVWVTGGDCPGPHYTDDYALILKSSDAGVSGTRQDGGPATKGTHLLGISAADAATAWTVGGKPGGLASAYIFLYTADGGATWTEQSQDGVDDANEVYAVDAQTVWVAADRDIFWSTDAGANWDYTANHGPSAGPYVLGISAVSDQVAWGCLNVTETEGQIWRTADGGNTWTVVDQAGGEALPGLWNISFATDPIPEPATAALLALGGLGAVLRRRNRR